ncbi:TIGR00730 family Rossman fold protein [uncultured Paludibaculum sp.]|uniref:LOG family protein n=1 Tax=uncultured Paludibaculum sp. TaxID=1765020 RepID=UPI002AAB26C9|nr:TIGR00730 family Rossman fold protein [uncultured Paludibaculum sp.]
MIRSVCVYCGSSARAAQSYFDAACLTGQILAERGHTLVYGGAHVGLMGALADSALALRGRVVGVIPQSLVDKEVAHNGLTEQHVVESMHVRKALMNELSDAFLALPGGFGTLDELFETLTWAQLKFHTKPVGLLNIDGYYDGLLAFARRAVNDGFIHPDHVDMILVGTDPGELLDRMAGFVAPETGKWWRRS